MPTRSIVRLTAAVLLTAWGGTVSAQGPLPGAPGGFDLASDSYLYPKVAVSPLLQADLKITDDQKAKLVEAMKPVEAAWLEHFKSTRQQGAPPNLGQMRKDRERIGQIMEDARLAVISILTPEQAKRMRQICRQVQGTAAFKDPEVQTGLKLTAEQKEKVDGILAEYGAALRKLPRPTPPRPGEAREAFQKRRGDEDKAKGELSKAAEDKFIGLLTDEQKKGWKEMVGEKIDVPKLLASTQGSRRPIP